MYIVFHFFWLQNEIKYLFTGRKKWWIVIILLLECLNDQTSPLRSVVFVIGNVNWVLYSPSGNNSIFILHRNIQPVGHFAYSRLIKIATSSKKSDSTWDVIFSSFLQERMYILSDSLSLWICSYIHLPAVISMLVEHYCHKILCSQPLRAKYPTSIHNRIPVDFSDTYLRNKV